MNVTCRIVLATLGLTAPEALADHHGMVMEPHGGSAFGTSVSLVAASFAMPYYVGDYEGVIPSLSWASPHVASARTCRCTGCRRTAASATASATPWYTAQAHVRSRPATSTRGVLLAVTAPTGDGQAGTGMGHPMAMPAVWAAWSHARLTFAGVGGYSRALVSAGQSRPRAVAAGRADEHVGDLVERVGRRRRSRTATHAGARVSGGVPVGAPGTIA